MNPHPYCFPFGTAVREVTQLADGSSKQAFVVGKYSSAVHARWIGPDRRMKVAALAVANEPYIFWRGENAAEYIPTINEKLGFLEAASEGHNGCSGRALDKFYLCPLGLTRNDVWLSDLVPHTLANAGQQRAVANYYQPIAEQCNLPQCIVPPVPTNTKAWESLINISRLRAELQQSKADTIITLGNDVILRFLNLVCEDPFPRLAADAYGIEQSANINGKCYKVIRLAHMRVTSIRPINRWRTAHRNWVNARAM